MVADKTYKQWYDYHLALLKKDKKMRYASPDALKMLAGDQAQRSLDAQEKAKKDGGGNMAGSAGGGLNVAPAPKPSLPTTRVGGNKPEPVPANEMPGIVKNPVSPKPTPTPLTPRGQVPAGSDNPNSYNNRMQARIAALGIKGYTASNPSAASLDAPELMATFTDAQYAELAKVLKGLGYNVKEKGALKSTLINYFEELFPSKTYAELLGKLKGRAIAGTGAGGEGDKPDLPLRQKGTVDKGTLVNIAQTVAMNTLMRRLTPEEEKAIVADWASKQAEGVVQTTSRKVKNKKTGKLEDVISTKKAFQQDTEELALEAKLKAENPEQYQLAQGIGFIDELKQILSGGM